jgi:hypothetical protein
MKTRWLYVSLVLLVGILLISGAVPVQCAGCGIKPIEIKPIPPVGCKDMVQVCVCDKRGNCEWQWACVPVY